MDPYPKIHSIWKRDPETNTIMIGEFSRPEFAYLADKMWVATEKVHGTNVRMIFDPVSGFQFADRAGKGMLPPKLYKALQDQFADLTPFLAEFDRPVCFYGEGYGPGVQKGGECYRDTPGFMLFDIKVGNYWLPLKETQEVAKRLGIEHVPVLYTGSLFALDQIVAEGIRSTWAKGDSNFFAEGLVMRPEVPLCDAGGQRIIAKSKTVDHIKKNALMARQLAAFR